MPVAVASLLRGRGDGVGMPWERRATCSLHDGGRKLSTWAVRPAGRAVGRPQAPGRQGGSGKREARRGRERCEARTLPGAGRRERPLRLCRGTAGTSPAEQQSKLRKQEDGEKTS